MAQAARAMDLVSFGKEGLSMSISRFDHHGPNQTLDLASALVLLVRGVGKQSSKRGLDLEWLPFGIHSESRPLAC